MPPDDSQLNDSQFRELHEKLRQIATFVENGVIPFDEFKVNADDFLNHHGFIAGDVEAEIARRLKEQESEVYILVEDDTPPELGEEEARVVELTPDMVELVPFHFGDELEVAASDLLERQRKLGGRFVGRNGAKLLMARNDLPDEWKGLDLVLSGTVEKNSKDQLVIEVMTWFSIEEPPAKSGWAFGRQVSGESRFSPNARLLRLKDG